MAAIDHEKIVKLLLTNYGKTFSEEIGISLKRETPSSLFQLLCAALLFSARIRSDIAVEAARALIKQGWTTPDGSVLRVKPAKHPHIPPLSRRFP
jgi:hypothetical protein